jgi:ATP phosphoribosyltransferase regulatory subunit
VAGTEQLMQIYAALGVKDAVALRDATQGLPADVARSLHSLLSLYGGLEVIAVARATLPSREPLLAALADIEALAAHAASAHPDVKVGVDLADIGGNGYYSGARFTVYAARWPDAIARGGRYDEVGAVFGRNRPAVGLSLDLKTVANLATNPQAHTAIRAPWGEDAALRLAVRRLRERGESVVCVLPGHEHEGQEFACDRELVAQGGEWIVRPL